MKLDKIYISSFLLPTACQEFEGIFHNLRLSNQNPLFSFVHINMDPYFQLKISFALWGSDGKLHCSLYKTSQKIFYHNVIKIFWITDLLLVRANCERCVQQQNKLSRITCQIASNPNKRCAPPRRSHFVIIEAASKLREQNKSCKKEESCSPP